MPKVLLIQSCPPFPPGAEEHYAYTHTQQTHDSTNRSTDRPGLCVYVFAKSRPHPKPTNTHHNTIPECHVTSDDFRRCLVFFFPFLFSHCATTDVVFLVSFSTHNITTMSKTSPPPHKRRRREPKQMRLFITILLLFLLLLSVFISTLKGRHRVTSRRTKSNLARASMRWYCNTLCVCVCVQIEARGLLTSKGKVFYSPLFKLFFLQCVVSGVASAN